MNTNIPEQELFKISKQAAYLSSEVLESVAVTIAERPEFPGRLNEHLQYAFARACFQLGLRHGNGDYDGYRNDQAIRRIGRAYVRYYCPEGEMRDELDIATAQAPDTPESLAEAHQHVAVENEELEPAHS